MANKIIFMGTPLFCVPILKSLHQNGYNIVTTYTQPPQKSHRGQKINRFNSILTGVEIPEELKDLTDLERDAKYVNHDFND